MPTNPEPQSDLVSRDITPAELRAAAGFKIPDKLLKPKEYLATLQPGEEFHTVHGMGLACGIGGRQLFFVLRKLQFNGVIQFVRPLHYRKV